MNRDYMTKINEIELSELCVNNKLKLYTFPGHGGKPFILALHYKVYMSVALLHIFKICMIN